MIPARRRPMRAHPLRLIFLLSAAACGDDSLLVRGSFADEVASASSPLRVVAGAGEHSAEVRDGAFELKDLPAGSTVLRMVRGSDTLARLELVDLEDGGELSLNALRIDRRSRKAFPATISTSGFGVVRVNGIRMAEEGRIPDQVRARGRILARNADGSALLFRPDNAELPDLRLVVGLAAAETGSGDAKPLERGDSVTVEGKREGAYVVVSRITLGDVAADAESAEAEGDEERADAAGGASGESDDAQGAAAPAPVRVRPTDATAPAVRREGRTTEKAREKARERQKERRKELEKQRDKGGGGKGRGGGKN